MIAKSLRRYGWRPSDAALASAMVLLGLLATRSVWQEIFFTAQFADQSHILLVPFVAAYLVWVRRIRFVRCHRTATWIGPLVILAGWLLMTVSPHWDIQSFLHLGAVLMVIGCLLSVVGKEVLVRFFPAFAALIFFVPVPGIVRHSFAEPVHYLIAEFTDMLFELMGVSADKAAGIISINGYPVTMGNVSSGMIMLFTIILLSYAFAFGMPLRNYVRFLMMAVSPMVAVVLNALRLILTVFLYSYAAPSLADAFHGISGWLVLAVTFVILCAFMRLFRRFVVPVRNFRPAWD